MVVDLGGQRVLDEVSFVAPGGATTAVLGPSGCGKSTLLRVVSGLEQASAGRVVLGGRDLAGVPAHRRSVGLAFQDRALFPHLDVAGNVGFALRMAGVPAPEVARRSAEVLALVGLSGFERRRVGSLSGGEAQRVALARALAADPAVLCLDEPLGSLDRVLHDRLVEELRTLLRSLRATVLLVTHDHTEALALADHLVVLGGGGASGGAHVLATGTPRDVWLRPPSLQVAHFLAHQILDVDDARRVGVPDALLAGARSVVVPPGAVRVWPVGPAAADTGALRGAPSDERHGEVVDVVVGAGRIEVDVEVADGLAGGVSLRADWGRGGEPNVGERVAVAVDPAGVWPLSR